MAAERSGNGVRLVALDEHGDRAFVIVKPAIGGVRDTNPAVSPDDRWVVFASSRGRAFEETSLWIAPLGVERTPLPLTHGPAIDTHPTWLPDGSAIVYASAAPHGDFDLWRLPIDREGRAGTAVQLTHGGGHEVTPAVAADGTIIYAEVTAKLESHLEELRPDGTSHALTDGPTDSSPALSPDGTTIVFSRAVAHATGGDSDLFRLDRRTGAIAPLVDVPLTDEGGPVFSPDGRYVFATSILRKANGSALFSSIIVIDRQEQPPRARILEDHAGAIARLTPALPHALLDAARLREDPEYLPALARIMAAAINADQDANRAPPAR